MRDEEGHAGGLEANSNEPGQERDEELIPDPRAWMRPHDFVREKLLRSVGFIPVAGVVQRGDE